MRYEHRLAGMENKNVFFHYQFIFYGNSLDNVQNIAFDKIECILRKYVMSQLWYLVSMGLVI